jgi:SpoVK/Ycf46/Vps4 family AAA+-type ATPase
MKNKYTDLRSTDYSIIKLYVALWALRIVSSDPHSTLLTRDADEFLEFVGEHLVWRNTALEIFLGMLSLEDVEKDEIREMGFQAAWLQFRLDYNYPHENAILKTFRELTRREKSLTQRVFKSSIEQIEKKIAKQVDPIRQNLLMLKELLGLNDTQCAILNFSAQMMQSQMAHKLAKLILTHSFDYAIHVLSVILGLDYQEVKSSLNPNGLLGEYRLIDICREPHDLEDVLKVPGNVQSCLTGQHDNLDEMMLHFVSPAKTTSLTHEDYPHLEEDRLALMRFLNGSRDEQAERVNVMFYGEPGTGKTEFAKVLASESGFTLYEVACANKDGASFSRAERLTALRITLRFLKENKKALLLFDEIEDIFPKSDDLFETFKQRSSAHFGKAWMNHMLENNPIPVIWVSNSIDQIDPAYLRRFSYHLEFRKPPLKVRQRIAEKYLSFTSVSRDFIHQIAQKSELTPALIESAARVVSLSKVDDSHEAERLASRIIQQSQNAMGLNQNSDLRVSHIGYHLDYLNVDSRYSIDQIATSLKINPSAAMCFYGLPGTGKTALAEHLAKELDRPLLAKRASDILSKWVGGSEKNIANMFREAQHEGAIFFLDEADSLLRNRESATKSWEVSQVNELLQQMERFEGIFICATNLFADLDAAVLRRFTFKISFKAMTLQQRERMFVQEALLGDTASLDESSQRRLHMLHSLVPGDFSVIKRQSRILGTTPKSADFLAELEAECRMKSNKQSRAIGFTV